MGERAGKKRTGRYIVHDSGKKALRACNLRIGKKHTTARLSPDVLDAIERIAAVENCAPREIYRHIARTRTKGIGITAAIRDFTLRYFMEAATVAGHRRAGHGTSFGKSSGQ